MNVPYIGITGFVSREEVNQVLDVFPENSHRKLMVGVLVSEKTLQGVPTKWSNRYPSPRNVAGIFPKHPMTINLVHFHTQEPVNLLDRLLEVTELGGDNFHGFQLNIKWPDIRVLERYKVRYPSSTFVLQCGSGALKSANNDPKILAYSVRDYVDVCGYVLVDPSGGRGETLVPEMALKFLDHLYNVLEGKMNIGVAGGLGISGETGELLQPIFDIFPDTSVDAEGKLRDVPDDILNVPRACRYSLEVLEALASVSE